MKKIEFRFLSAEDVVSVGLSAREAVDLVEDVFKEHARKSVENPPKPLLEPAPGGFFHAMPASLKNKEACGLKWVGGFAGNQERGLPDIMAMIVLNDINTGELLAVMDGTYITALRTAAASGVAFKYLAPENARQVGIVGAGVQARYHLAILADLLPEIQVVNVTSRTESRLTDFVNDMNAKYPFEVRAVDSYEKALTNADIIITTASHLKKVIYKTEWLKPGSLILPVHSKGFEKTLPHDLDKLVVDDWPQFVRAIGIPGEYYHPLPDEYLELGEIVIGARPGRESQTERILVFNYGLAIADVMMATEILKRAREQNIGVDLTMMERELP